MKVRNGFVSNSSSSSFCIYGISLEIDDLINRMKETNILSKERHNKKFLRYIESGSYSELEGIIFDETELWTYFQDNIVFIGKAWNRIGDDETGRQFKESVESSLEKILGSPVYCSNHEEATSI